MIGKRVILFKRPAVLCAAAFIVGMVLAGDFGKGVWGCSDGKIPGSFWGMFFRRNGWLALSLAIGLFGACALFLHRLKTGGRQASVMDRLLYAIPAFLLLGFWIMSRERFLYETNVTMFSECMNAGKEVLAEGTVSHIRRTKSGVRLELKDAVAASYTAQETVYRPVGKLLVYTDDILAENGELKYGQQVFVYGNGSEFEGASNPGCFDAKEYYFSLGITGAIHGKTVRIKSFSYHRLNQALFQAKNKLLNSYVTYLGEEGAGVISSMLLGERALLSEETEELYRHGGISHILAISGLHVSLIGMALYEFLRKTMLGRNGAIPVACGAVLLYGNFVEAGTSTKRAVIMFLLLLLATVLGRTYDTLSAMSVSMAAILCQSPGALYTASFQLSFAAAYGASVLAMILKGQRGEQDEAMSRRVSDVDGTGIPLKDCMENAQKVARRKKSKWVRVQEVVREKLKSLFLFGLAIQAVTFPFTVYHFFEYPAYGFLINPLVVPLMTILLLCGMLSGVCGLFLPWLGYFFAGGTDGILWIYDTLCRWSEKLPCSLLLVGRPAVWQIGVYFAVLAVCLYVYRMGEKILKKGHVVCGILLLLPLCLLPLPGAKFEAAFLDVGQGDGIVLREQNGAVLLVDGGSTGVQNVGEKRIIPYLKSQGIRVIDCAFVSHTDSDHISGLKEILEAMPVYSVYRERVAGYTGTPVVKRIVLPELYGKNEIDPVYLGLVELAKEKNVEVCYMAAGDRMKVGKDLVFSCLAPESGVTYADKNGASMVLLTSYGEFDLLLTGDMDRDGEARLLEEGIAQYGEGHSVEVLKVAHHGSYTASSQAFISALHPLISVISCGKDNRYGHPHKETLDNLYGANSRVYRTDESGCVRIKVKRGGKAEVKGWREPG